MKKDYIYIALIIICAFIGIYAYYTKPAPKELTTYEKKIDSLKTVLQTKDTVIEFHINKYNDLKTAIHNRTRRSYKPVPVSERNSTIIELAKK